MKASVWIIRFFMMISLVSVIVIVINLAADPYDLWDAHGYETCHNERMKKAYQLQVIKPKSVILGSSRAEYAMDPSHPYFKQPAYNLAFKGATAFETKLFFRRAVELGVEDALLVVGYRFFGKGKRSEDPALPDYLDSRRDILFNALFSWDSLKHSLKLLAGRDSKAIRFSHRGQYDNDFRKQQVMQRGGFKKVFEKNEKGYYASYDHDFHYNGGLGSAMDDLRSMLDLAYEKNIHFVIVLGPSHVRQWECLAYYIGYERFAQWKRDLVRINQERASAHHRDPFQIWDFATYHALTSEDVPEDPGAEMIYYFDSSHYNAKLGGIVLDRLLGKDPYHFGGLIDEINIDHHLADMEKNRERFIDTGAYHAWFDSLHKRAGDSK